MVFPGISSDDNRVPGLLVNFRALDQAHSSLGIGMGRFEDYFLEEIIPYVDGRFRTVADTSGRAVEGFSLGGFQCMWRGERSELASVQWVIVIVLVIEMRSLSFRKPSQLRLAGNIGLTEKLESFAEQHGGSAIRVVNVQRQRRKPARMRQQRVSEMHVHFRHQKRRQKFGQLGRHLTQLHHDHRANPEGDIVPAKKFLHLLGIAHNDSRDGGICRFRDAERHDMSIMRMQQLHHVQHRADFVGEKDRELFDERSVNF